MLSFIIKNAGVRFFREPRTVNRALLILLAFIAFTPLSAHAVPPEAPYDLVATAVSSSQVQFTWSESSPDILGFYVDVWATDWTYWNSFGLPGDARSLLIEYLAPGTEYSITISAYNSSYEYSPQVSTTVTTASVAGPSNVTATAFSTTEILLTWTDSRTDEVGFEIEITGGPYSPDYRHAYPDSTSYTIDSLYPNTLYTFRIRSYDAGYGYSAYSLPAQATTLSDGTNPALQAVALSSKRIKLTWTDPTTNETAYIVEYRADGAVDFSALAELPADTTSYTHENLEPNRTYEYRVKSFNGMSYGPPSNAVTVTTPGCVQEGQYLQ
jgi:hypothetical protein